MARAIIGVCTLHLDLLDTFSMHEKRGLIKSLIKRLRTEFNVSCAEIDENDQLDSAVIAFAVVSNSSRHADQMLQTIVTWIEAHFHELEVASQQHEIL
jgi:uncharacterized protein